MTVAKLAKKAQTAPLLLPNPSRPRQLELDELWTFVGRKKRKEWLWLAVERHTRRIVAYVGRASHGLVPVGRPNSRLPHGHLILHRRVAGLRRRVAAGRALAHC